MPASAVPQLAPDDSRVQNSHIFRPTVHDDGPVFSGLLRLSGIRFDVKDLGLHVRTRLARRSRRGSADEGRGEAFGVEQRRVLEDRDKDEQQEHCAVYSSSPMAWNSCGSDLAVRSRTTSPMPMKRITTSVATMAPSAPLPPATTPLTTVATAPAAAVGRAVWRRVRASLDGMAAAPLAGGGKVVSSWTSVSPGRVGISGQRTVALRSFGSGAGSREPYHKLFDEVFTMEVCCPSHLRVMLRVCAQRAARCLVLGVDAAIRQRDAPVFRRSGKRERGPIAVAPLTPETPAGHGSRARPLGASPSSSLRGGQRVRPSRGSRAPHARR